MAKVVDVESVGSYFQLLSDPRHTRNRKHLLGDIIVIAICGILCNCDGPTAIHRWAVLQADWLRQLLVLPNGIPSRDCIRRLFLEHFSEREIAQLAGLLGRLPGAQEGGSCTAQ